MLGEDVVRGREVRIYVVRATVAGAVHEVVQVQRVMQVEVVIQPEADERHGAAIVSVHAVAAHDLAAGGLDVGSVPAVFAEGGVDRLSVIPGVGGREGGVEAGQEEGLLGIPRGDVPGLRLTLGGAVDDGLHGARLKLLAGGGVGGGDEQLVGPGAAADAGLELHEGGEVVVVEATPIGEAELLRRLVPQLYATHSVVVLGEVEACHRSHDDPRATVDDLREEVGLMRVEGADAVRGVEVVALLAAGDDVDGAPQRVGAEVGRDDAFVDLHALDEVDGQVGGRYAAALRGERQAVHEVADGVARESVDR